MVCVKEKYCIFLSLKATLIIKGNNFFHFHGLNMIDET